MKSSTHRITLGLTLMLCFMHKTILAETKNLMVHGVKTSMLNTFENSKFFITTKNIIGDYRVQLWNSDTGKATTLLYDNTPDMTKTYITDLWLSHSGKILVAACNDQTIMVWETNTGKLLYTFRTARELKALDISRNDQFILTQYEDAFELWNRGKQMGMTADIKSVAMSLDSKYLVTQSQSNKIQIMDLANFWDPVTEIPKHFTAISADENFIIAGPFSTKKSSEKIMLMWEQQKDMTAEEATTTEHKINE